MLQLCTAHAPTVSSQLLGAPDEAHADTAALAAAMLTALLQQLQQPHDLPGIVKQLQDLAQHISSGSSNTATISNAVLLLAQQLPENSSASSSADMRLADQTQADCSASDMECDTAPADTQHMGPPAAVAKVLIAHTAVQLLSKLDCNQVQQLPEQQAQHMQQAASTVLANLALLSCASEGAVSTTQHSCMLEPTWLQPLQQCLRNSITAAAARAVLQCCNLWQHPNWLAALPALVACMQTRTLNFLYALPNLPRTSGLYQAQQRNQRQQNQQWQKAEGYAAMAARVFQQLASINPQLTSDMTLQSVVLALAPGLLGVLQVSLQLVPLIQNQQKQGNRWTYNPAVTCLNEAVRSAMKQAPLEELLQSWGVITAYGQQEVYRQRMQHAVVDALLQWPGAGSSSALYGAAITNRTALDASGATQKQHMSAEELLRDQLLFGDLYRQGPGQLLQLLCQWSPTKSSWPHYLSYVLVPAALLQLLEQYMHQTNTEAVQASEDPTSSRQEHKGLAKQNKQWHQEQLETRHSLSADILRFVRQWLLHQPTSNGGLASLVQAQQNRPDLVQLYYAAELLLRNCPAGTFCQPEHASAVDAAAEVSCNNSTTTTSSYNTLLQYVLHVLADEQLQLTQQQLVQVLKAAGQLGSIGCRGMLQQHYFNSLQPWLQLSAPEENSSVSSLLPGASAAMQRVNLSQLVGSSMQAADVYVSAVLGCLAGSNGSSMLALGAAVAEQAALGAQAAGGPANADAGWTKVQQGSKRQRHQYGASGQHKQPPTPATDTGRDVSVLQQQVLLLLADALQATALLSSSAAPGPSGALSDCLLATAEAAESAAMPGVKLLQSTDDLLQGHFLWVKLLHGLLAKASSSTTTGASGCSTRGSQLQPVHLVATEIVHNVCSLYDKLHSGKVTVNQLQQLQEHRHAFTELVAAVQQHASQASDAHCSTSICSSCCVTGLQDAFAAAEAVLWQQRQQAKALEQFYSTMCPSVGATADLETYIADLSAKNLQLGNMLVLHLGSANAWDKHWQLVAPALEVHKLLSTTPFVNSLKLSAAAKAASSTAVGNATLVQYDQLFDHSSLSNLEADHDVDPRAPDVSAGGDAAKEAVRASVCVADVCQLMPQLLSEFKARWTAVTGIRLQSSAAVDETQPTAAAVLALWVSEHVPDVAAEYSAIMQWLSCKHDVQQAPHSTAANSSTHVQAGRTGCLPVDCITAILRLHQSSIDCPLGEQLEALHAAFNLAPSPLLTAAQQLPKAALSEVQLPAEQLATAYQRVEQGLGVLSAQQGLLQELGRSAALQEFLASTSADELRRLADGVEDHGEDHGATWFLTSCARYLSFRSCSSLRFVVECCSQRPT